MKVLNKYFSKHKTAKFTAKFLVLASAALFATGASAEPITVTLMGTGTPSPVPNRFSQSILIQANDQNIMVDAGRGASIRLWELGVPMGSIDGIFITHMHSDHIDGLQDVWSTGWIGTPYGSRTEPLSIYGPKGTVAMTEHLTKAFAGDIEIRHADENFPMEGIAWDAHDISAGEADAYAPNTVWEKNGLKVTVFNTNHGDLIKPNFGYIIENEDHKVVISGDTKYDERIVKACDGCDLLIHEVAFFDPKLVEQNKVFVAIQNHHTAPDEAGKIFTQAKPKLAAYTHVLYRALGAKPNSRTDDILSETRKTYDGPLAIGDDQMRFVIDSEGVEIIPDARKVK